MPLPEDVDASCIPDDRSAELEDIEKFNELNAGFYGIYLYEWSEKNIHGEKFEWPERILFPTAPAEDEICLLLFKGHYIYIHDFRAFMSRQHSAVQDNTSTHKLPLVPSLRPALLE